MRGKDKCKILKQIRAEIAQQNDIEWITKECEHQGECKGTCPRCEAEVRKLERELELKKRLGQSVAIVGLTSVVALANTGCILEDAFERIQQVLDPNDIAGGIEPIELDGDVEWIPPETDAIEIEGEIE